MTRVFIDIDMPNYYEIIIPMNDKTRVFKVLKVYHIATNTLCLTAVQQQF